MRNNAVIGGVIVLIFASLSAFLSSSPIIWIGGFIWGISLIAQGSNKQTYSSYSYVGGKYMEKEITTCSNCGQRLNIPKDRQKYTDIKCSNCHQSPFLSLSNSKNWVARNLKKVFSNKINTILFLSIIAIAAYIYYLSTYSENVVTPPIIQTNTAPAEIKPASLVTKAAHDPISLPTGTIIKKNSSYLQGYGELNIKNGTNNDAVAKLVVGSSSIFSVYIKANSTYTIKDISDGNYRLYFALGKDWDTTNKVFLQNPHPTKFDEIFDFYTRVTYDGNYENTRYGAYEVTLNSVLGGNARTSCVDLAEFNNY
mgnify:FL=1